LAKKEQLRYSLESLESRVRQALGRSTFNCEMLIRVAADIVQAGLHQQLPEAF
jgi:hypothetical protein